MQENEVRERERSEGKRMTGVRQLVKESEWREERDLRAVKERERSAEQLEMWRETRWRKGLELSQTVALCGEGWMQGSLAVGMLRDSSASICLGSSVEEEEEESVSVVVKLVVAEAARKRRRRRNGTALSDGGGGSMVESVSF
ncbi:hypothetical protein V6N13_015565 [Hibiscus sabdariffa]|uniref:Uncharacterized protein n=1 Tax=Hibiscus sabdariffa TaxID=183260 RepID=A0ABR2CW29_9ROSI